MRAYRLATIVSQNGELQINSLPFQPGEAVEVIILALENGDPANHVVASQKTQRQLTLASIQGGKYARLQHPGEPLASEIFATVKAEEMNREERRWIS